MVMGRLISAYKGKVFPVYATKECRVKNELHLHPFLTWAQDVDELSSRPGFFVTGKEPRCPLSRRLGGPQSRTGLFGEKSVALVGI